MRATIAVLATFLAAGGAFAGWLQFSGNVHEVIAGELYRSGRLGVAQFEDVVDRYGIRTVINLEGDKDDAEWYVREVAASDARGVAHVDLGWSAARELTDADVAEFLRVASESEKPLLIHCRAGADRTGLAVALYLAALDGSDEASAEWQLSFFYGHIGLPFTYAWAMNETFERLEPALGFPNS
jgi:protein tyrosine/serine phosphatase